MQPPRPLFIACRLRLPLACSGRWLYSHTGHLCAHATRTVAMYISRSQQYSAPNNSEGHATTQSRPVLSYVAHRRCCIYSDYLSLSTLSRNTASLQRYCTNWQITYAAIDGPHSRAHHTGQALLLNFYFPTACQSHLRLSRSLIPSALTCASPLCAYRFGHTTSASGTPYPHTCICTL